MSYRALDGYSSTNTAADGYSLTVRAQSTSFAGATGGDLKLASGDGVVRDGYVRMYAGSDEQARFINNFTHFLTGQRIRVDLVTTTPFTVSDGYYALLVDTSTVAITLTLPTTPVLGDSYHIKDMSGNSAANNITVDGGTKKIDHAVNTTYTINTNYGNALFVYNGTSWSVL